MSNSNPDKHDIPPQFRRDAVNVDGVRYRSVYQAFVELGLPTAGHIKFRMELKQARRLHAFGYEWCAIALNYTPRNRG